MTEKQDASISRLQETHFRSKDTHRLKVRAGKNVFHISGTKRKFG